MPGEAWVPTLPDVARHIPTRTRDVKTPGSDVLLNTFTASTTPTAEQAQAVIDTVAGTLLAFTGPLPASNDIQTAARSAVEWRSAADIEIAYPNRDADVQVYQQLDGRATAAWNQLVTILEAAGSGPGLPDEMVTYSFPPPVRWGDVSPGSGIYPPGYRPPPFRRSFG